ncbi:MAG: hypothetical protein QM703_26875 [Gemmatales bacterium]
MTTHRHSPLSLLGRGAGGEGFDLDLSDGEARGRNPNYFPRFACKNPTTAAPNSGFTSSVGRAKRYAAQPHHGDHLLRQIATRRKAPKTKRPILSGSSCMKW